jgi:hypothetical protein
MTDSRRFILAHDVARARAVQCVREAPEHWTVTVSPPKRSLDQNAAMWPILEAFAEQLLWPVNGQMVRLEPEEWKDVLTAAFKQETQRIAMGLNGGMVILGMRTSRMSKQSFSEFLEFIHAVAADRGVHVGVPDAKQTA